MMHTFASGGCTFSSGVNSLPLCTGWCHLIGLQLEFMSDSYCTSMHRIHGGNGQGERETIVDLFANLHPVKNAQCDHLYVQFSQFSFFYTNIALYTLYSIILRLIYPLNALFYYDFLTKVAILNTIIILLFLSVMLHQCLSCIVSCLLSPPRRCTSSITVAKI